MSITHVCDSYSPPTIATPHVEDGYFAFATINGSVSLVQVSYATPASALTAVDVKIFRHEFITIFRLVEAKSLHPSDICILETIDDKLTRYEEENETVFLARDLMERMRKHTDSRFMTTPVMQRTRGYHRVVQNQRQRQR